MLDLFVEMARDAIDWADLRNQRPVVLVRVGWFLCELVIAGFALIGPLIVGALFLGFLAYVGIRRLLGY
jgi:hypothetical protein